MALPGDLLPGQTAAVGIDQMIHPFAVFYQLLKGHILLVRRVGMQIHSVIALDGLKLIEKQAALQPLHELAVGAGTGKILRDALAVGSGFGGSLYIAAQAPAVFDSRIIPGLFELQTDLFQNTPDGFHGFFGGCLFEFFVDISHGAVLLGEILVRPVYRVCRRNAIANSAGIFLAF